MESTSSADTDRIRRIAASLFEQADPTSIDRAALLIKTAAEAENQAAQAAKYAAEEKKLRDDLSAAAKKRRDREERRAYITSFSPVIATVLSTFALTGTLFLQYFQYRSQRDQSAAATRLQTEAAKDQRASAQATLDMQNRAATDQRTSSAKSLELQTQAATDQRVSAARALELQTLAAEDVRWNEAIKVLTSDTRLSPAEALLSTFSESPRYKTPATSMAEILLFKSKSMQEFTSTFNDVFAPMKWGNLNYAIDVNRHISEARNPIALKAYEKGAYDETRIKEQAEQFYLYDAELVFISSKMGPLLRTSRPAGIDPMDFTFVSLWDVDLHGADLSGAILTNASVLRVDLKGADLSGITKWENAKFEQTAWWEARAVSPDLLTYLKRVSPYRPDTLYGSLYTKVYLAEYDRDLERLEKVPSPIETRKSIRR